MRWRNLGVFMATFQLKDFVPSVADTSDVQFRRRQAAGAEWRRLPKQIRLATRGKAEQFGTVSIKGKACPGRVSFSGRQPYRSTDYYVTETGLKLKVTG